MRTNSKPICFSIMPFDEAFDAVNSVIERAAKKCKMEYVRGDARNESGIIMPQILSDIRRAAVIVADISGLNPNVFYELGVAHQLKGPGQVVIISQPMKKRPFNVGAYRHIDYRCDASGLTKLEERLPSCIELALRSQTDQEIWNVTRSPLERTHRIIRDLQHLLKDLKLGTVKNVLIRTAAGLGSLAICDEEPPLPLLGPDYNAALKKERNALRDVLAAGATMHSLLHPPRRFTKRLLEESLHLRYRRLIGLFDGKLDRQLRITQKDLAAMKRSRFCLTDTPMPNLFIIDSRVAYEGLKRGSSWGYAMTHCENDHEAVQTVIKEFDMHFKECGGEGPGSKRNVHVRNKLKTYMDEAIEDAKRNKIWIG